MGKVSKKYSVADFRLAIEAVGASPAAIARELTCTRGTVYSYLKRFPELKAVYEAAKGATVEDKPQFPKEKFIEAIRLSMGVKSSVAAIVGCSRQTVDNALERWPELVEQLATARAVLIGMAAGALVDDIQDKTSPGHQRAYMYTLKTQAKDEGFVERSEVTGADGAALLDVPADVLQQIKDAGLNVAEVLRNLAAMTQQEA
jgi:predicted transcriptional regulator